MKKYVYTLCALTILQCATVESMQQQKITSLFEQQDDFITLFPDRFITVTERIKQEKNTRTKVARLSNLAQHLNKWSDSCDAQQNQTKSKILARTDNERDTQIDFAQEYKTILDTITISVEDAKKHNSRKQKQWGVGFLGGLFVASYFGYQLFSNNSDPLFTRTWFSENPIGIGQTTFSTAATIFAGVKALSYFSENRYYRTTTKDIVGISTEKQNFSKLFESFQQKSHQ